MIDDLFEAAPIGLGVVGSDLRVVHVNPAAVRLAGRSVADMVGRTPTEIAGDAGRAPEAAIRSVLETGQRTTERLEGALDERRGLRRAFDLDYFAVPGGVGVAVVEVTDKVAAERVVAAAQRRDALLARAAELLGAALSVQETADLVARLVVPELADWCFVELAREGRIDRVAWSHRDPSKLPWFAEVERRYPLDPDSAVGSPKVVRTGEPELVHEIPDEWLVHAAQDEDHLRILRELGLRSTIIVPLVARGRILGDLALATDAESGRLLGEEELTLTQALADRCAAALDNARLYAQRELVATTLQEELLPPRLPSIPGVDLAARYSAAGEGNEVGGDFYDVFPCGDGWQVVIGDVVGKGPAAAAITGLARHTLRTAADYEEAPSRLLHVLNHQLLAERPGERMASVACVRIDREEDALRLTVSAAGHPLPLVVGCDGTVREVGRFGQLLGAEDDLVVFDATDRLLPGELLVLFTDGVVEVHGPRGVFGEDHLRALLSGAGGHEPAQVLRRVEGAVLAASGDRPRDDVAMIALRCRPPR